MSRTSALAAAALVLLVSLFSHLGAIGFLGPDEPRYVWIAREMAATGDWVTPRLYGRPWLEKPILYYWAAAVGFRLHLAPEWAGRLPSALAALLAAIAMARLALRHEDAANTAIAQSASFWAPLIFATCVGAIGFSRSAGPDMLFTASLTVAMAAAARALAASGSLRGAIPSQANGRRDLRALGAFGGALGFAVLAKGPAGVILAGGAIALWVLASRQWRSVFQFLHPVVIVSFCVVALPWYILCAQRNPDFLRVFLYEHNFNRYLSNEFQHRQPFWFFAPIILFALLPWAALLIPAAERALESLREKRGANYWARSPSFFFAAWTIFPVLFFSVSQSKLPGYVLPAIPPACLVLGIVAARKCREKKARAWLAFLLALPWLLLPVAMYSETQTLFATEGPHFTLACVALAVSFALAFAAAWRYSGKRLAAIFGVSLALAAISIELAGLAVLPLLDALLSSRRASAMVASVPAEDVRTYGVTRGTQFGLNFYLRREIPEWRSDEAGTHYVFTTIAGELEVMKHTQSLTALSTESPQAILVEVKTGDGPR